ncbi:MAG: hypothetical protein MOB07_24670 [Acidobacteria bacterium]|nr:hypothetical protein [Acidobacteriota bacterium]MCI0489083.1 hypothetical protein [Blastocatellia bacterium]
MKSIRNLHDYPAGIPLPADEMVEFHAARLLLLLLLCGQHGHIDGLTKLAKLDFFVRYPGFFRQVCNHLGQQVESPLSSVESSMVRHHYGPWDKRYYHVLAYLEARDLIDISKSEARAFRFELTPAGKETAEKMTKMPEFASISEHMRQVKEVLGSKKGSALKKLIYEVFDEEVAKRRLGEVIQ